MVTFSAHEYLRDNVRPSSSRDDDEDCPICSEDWAQESREVVAIHCGHNFHRDCLLEWLSTYPSCNKNANKCPICRSICFDSPPSRSALSEGASEFFRNIENVLAPDLSLLTADNIQLLTDVDITNREISGRYREAMESLHQYLVEYAGAVDPDMTPGLTTQGCADFVSYLYKSFIIVHMIRTHGADMSFE